MGCTRECSALYVRDTEALLLLLSQWRWRSDSAVRGELEKFICRGRAVALGGALLRKSSEKLLIRARALGFGIVLIGL